MRKREALKLHDEDEVIVKRDGSVRRVLNSPRVEPVSGDVLLETLGDGAPGGDYEVLRHTEVK